MKKHIVALAVSTACMVALPAAAQDCDWKPTRAVTYIVPWSPGGGTDTNSRMLATLLSEHYGVPFNVINRTGGNGVVGHTALAQADPDGYTIGTVTSEIDTMHHAGLTDLTYEAYTPIALSDMVAAGVSVAADSQFGSMQELLDYARENPGELTATGTAIGGIWQLALAGMLNSAGMEPDSIRWIPSQGAAPGIQEMLSGGVDLVSTALSEATSVIQSGQARGLAYMADERNPYLPDVPTLKEATGDDWTLASFQTIAGPAGLPDEVACSYVEAVKTAIETQEWKDFKASRSAPVVYEGPDGVADLWRRMDEDLGTVMKAIGLSQEG